MFWLHVVHLCKCDISWYKPGAAQQAAAWALCQEGLLLEESFHSYYCILSLFHWIQLQRAELRTFKVIHRIYTCVCLCLSKLIQLDDERAGERRPLGWLPKNQGQKTQKMQRHFQMVLLCSLEISEILEVVLASWEIIKTVRGSFFVRWKYLPSLMICGQSTDNESQITHDSTLKRTMCTVRLKGPKLPIRNGTAVLSQGEQHDPASESCWLLRSC